ncbi:MAG: element excision factor XisH family protein [Cyanobacteria bacterium J06627_3]
MSQHSSVKPAWATRCFVADAVLYLAVPNRIFESFFQLEFPQAIIEENQVKLIVYDVQQEVIVSWTS